MNTVHFDTEICKGCLLCVTVCPAKAIHPGTLRNAMGYFVPAADNAKCTGCLTCEYVCPDMSVWIEKDPKKE